MTDLDETMNAILVQKTLADVVRERDPAAPDDDIVAAVDDDEQVSVQNDVHRTVGACAGWVRQVDRVVNPGQK